MKGRDRTDLLRRRSPSAIHANHGPFSHDALEFRTRRMPTPWISTLLTNVGKRNQFQARLGALEYGSVAGRPCCTERS